LAKPIEARGKIGARGIGKMSLPSVVEAKGGQRSPADQITRSFQCVVGPTLQIQLQPENSAGFAREPGEEWLNHVSIMRCGLNTN